MVAAHILRHDITGNRARRAAQDDDGDERLLAEAHVHRDRQEDDRQQDELDEGGGAGRAEQPPSMLRNLSAIGGKSIDSSENGRPARMPRMIGLVMMPRSVRLTTP